MTHGQNGPVGVLATLSAEEVSRRDLGLAKAEETIVKVSCDQQFG